jgi:hypothetical protein
VVEAGVGNLQPDVVRLEADGDARPRGGGVPLDVVHRSLGDAEDGQLGVGRQPPRPALDGELEIEAAAVAHVLGEGVECGGEPEVVEHRGTQVAAEASQASQGAAGQLLQVDELA